MLSSRRRFALPCLWLLLVSQLGRAFTIPDDPSERPINHHRWRRFSVDADQDVDVNADGRLQRNSQYIKGLQENLGGLLDKYICNGSPKTKERIFNVLDQIEAEAMDQELIQQSIRMTKRAGVPMDTTYLEKFTPKSELGKTDAASRRKEAEDRQRWEAQRSTSEVGSNTASNISKGRSALSRRATTNGKPDLFMPGNGYNPDDIANIANDKENLQKEMDTASSDGGNISETTTLDAKSSEAAANKVSEFVARAGAGSSFDGEAMGIGGLNDVLAQIKRRVWTPLAAPPQLLEELGIHPVRGLLLYGKPGCGKTLLARTLGNILSPMRPITVVSGPEVMDKFVGSSEKNLREIFDNPPDIYDTYRLGEPDGGDAIARAALHVIIMDEFDAIARTRGGRDGKGGQGDAGVARDSVVNQMLAKMDGVHPLPVPTLVIGLTNKRSLIEPALLRPGRFEVQVEVPPPKTIEQRRSILKVHTRNMQDAGRLLVRDPPEGSAAAKYIQEHGNAGLVTYNELLLDTAKKCDNFSGAAIAGVARAAASHALERAVNEFSQTINDGSDHAKRSSINDCLVRIEDFSEAIADVEESMGDSDFTDDEKEVDKATDEITPAINNDDGERENE